MSCCKQQAKPVQQPTTDFTGI